MPRPHATRPQDRAQPERITLAIEALRAGNPETATRLCRAILADGPQAQAHHLLGMIAARAGDMPEAERQFRAAATLNPADPDDANNLGNVLMQLGRREEALACYEAAVRLRANFADALYNQARLLAVMDRLAESEQLFARFLALRPDHAMGLCQYGNVILMQQRPAEALPPLERALQLAPGMAEAWSNKGAALHGLERMEEALECHETALRLQPDMANPMLNRARAQARLGRPEEALESFRALLAAHPDLTATHAEIGKLLLELKRWDEAVAALDRALEFHPEMTEAWCNKGAGLHGLEDLEGALVCYRRAIELDPTQPDAYYNRANVLNDMRRHEEALAAFDETLAVKPDHASALSNKGTVLVALQRPEEALACFDRALELEPDRVVAISLNRGIALCDMWRLDEAIAANDHAIALDPEFAMAHHNDSLFHLLLGDYERGWAKHHWRWKGQGRTAPEELMGKPLWDGQESLEGKRLLLTSEQGLGDTIQFARFAALAAERGATVLMGVHKGLQRLMRGLEGADIVAEIGMMLPDFDFHRPLMDLPAFFQTRVDSIPARVPYLRVSRALIARWDRILAASERDQPGLRRVGFTYFGNPGYGHDHKRSMKLRNMLRLLTATQLGAPVQFVCLHKVLPDEDRAVLEGLPQVTLVADAIEDFADTAAIVETLDLVVSVDTAVAHLTGALGRPVWVTIPMMPDWRWLLDRADSPWYPTARLFRQRRAGDWDQVIEDVVGALQARVAARPVRVLEEA